MTAKKSRVWVGAAASITLLTLGTALVAVPLAAQPAAQPGAAAAFSVPSYAVFSPDGLKAAWIGEEGTGFLFARRKSSADPWQSAGGLSIRGIVRTPVFSPDGKRLAFENMRGGYVTTARYRGGPSYNWSYIALYDFDSARISYVDPGFGIDSKPTWEGVGSVSFTRRVAGIAETRVVRPTEPPPLAVSDADKANLGLLDALLSAPISYQPVRSADGLTLAYVAREGRTRSIYVAGLSGNARAVVYNEGDDGLELSQLTLSPDGKWLAYVRGGAANNKGEYPNARSMLVPPGEQIWLVPTDGSAAPRRISAGHKPQFLPTGSSLLWQTEAGVARMTIGIDGTIPAGPVDYVISGPVSQLRISPDGRFIAYERTMHVETLELATGIQQRVEKPGTATDSFPTWSPDSGNLAMVRSYGSASSADGMVDQPWEIIVARRDASQARVIWKAEKGIGSAFYPLDQDQTKNGVEQDQLLWSVTGDIAFAWERDGWRHLYAVPASGGSARLLTPGDGEVEAASVSMDGKTIHYSTNIGNLASRNMWSIPFAGGVPKPLSNGSSSQWGPLPLAGNALAMVQATHSSPPSVVVRDSQGRVKPVGGPVLAAAFPARHMVLPQPVSFTSPDGGRAFGELFMPEKSRGCGIIFIHGGSRRHMLLGFHYIDVYSNLYELNQYFTMRGCTVLSIEYRSGIMLGHAFRNAPDVGDRGAREYQDVLGGLNYLRSRKDLGVEKIGIYGLSYGGLMTAHALARDSDKFAVGFDMAGVHAYAGKSFEYSPAAYADRWSSPVYFASGDDDRNVDHNHSILLYNSIRERRPDLDVVGEAFPNEVHDLYLTMDDLVRVYWKGSQFMLKYLDSQPAMP